MSPVADSTLFDGNFSSAVNHLMHLPVTLEKLVFPPHEHQNQNHHSHGGKIPGDVPMDILETSKVYTFFLDVPGLSKSDIQVTVEDESILVIRSNGKRKREDGEEEGACKYLRLERKAASPKFLRKFRIPEDSNTSAISARCENGVLTVTVEKLPPPEKKLRTVEVAVA